MRVLGLQPEGLISIEAAEKVQSRLTQSEEEE